MQYFLQKNEKVLFLCKLCNRFSPDECDSHTASFAWSVFEVVKWVDS